MEEFMRISHPYLLSMHIIRGTLLCDIDKIWKKIWALSLRKFDLVIF